MSLAAVPLRPRADEVLVRGRLSLGRVDYHALVESSWDHSAVSARLAKVLFVFHDWSPLGDMGNMNVVDAVLWRPDAGVKRTLEADWAAVQSRVAAGRAEDVSESDGLVLMAAASPGISTACEVQPFSDTLAVPREWALRPSFVASVLTAARAGHPAPPDPSMPIADQVIQAISGHVGRRVEDVEFGLGLEPSAAKHRSTLVIERLVRAATGLVRADLVAAGIDMRVVQVDADYRPYESLSFPAFRYRELVEEEWHESELRSRLNQFILVPVMGGKGLAAVGVCAVQPPLLWSPTDAQLRLISTEWRGFRDEVRSGRALKLTPASQTRYIHVRPKGRTALHTDPAPMVGPVVKKCFWFNRNFVADILQGRADSACGTLHATSQLDV
jgi:DNA mismatch repair protein MutH